MPYGTCTLPSYIAPCLVRLVGSAVVEHENVLQQNQTVPKGLTVEPEDPCEKE